MKLERLESRIFSTLLEVALDENVVGVHMADKIPRGLEVAPQSSPVGPAEHLLVENLFCRGMCSRSTV